MDTEPGTRFAYWVAAILFLNRKELNVTELNWGIWGCVMSIRGRQFTVHSLEAPLVSMVLLGNYCIRYDFTFTQFRLYDIRNNVGIKVLVRSNQIALGLIRRSNSLDNNKDESGNARSSKGQSPLTELNPHRPPPLVIHLTEVKVPSRDGMT